VRTAAATTEPAVGHATASVETAEAPAERVLMSAMAMNPLVAMDHSQILAAGGRVLARALAQPQILGARVGALVRELGEIVAGTSQRAPDAADRRFADSTFAEHPLYRRLMQCYLAWRHALLALVDEVRLDARSRDRGRFAVTLLTEALAPTNTLLGNPAAMKRAFETGGASLWSGLRHLADDLRHHGGMPSQVDRRAFRVGENLARSPGQVVFRSDALELIQYQPATARVHELPLLFVPPQINKYYVLDLAPGRSMVEHMVQQGFQVFAVSWRNVTPSAREWNLGTYVRALAEATDVAREISGSPRLNVASACAGGITTAVLLGYLAALGDERIGAATFMVTVLDTAISSLLGMLVTEKTVASSIRRSAQKGVLAGSDLARAFTLLRPNDLLWSYWVNNYLLGANPPAFDVLYWNNDPTNLPAALHADFVALFLENSLCTPGQLRVLDTDIDLGRVTASVYAVGALADHITPWEACYRTPQLFGGERTFIASSGGHIQALVNPPSNTKGRFFVGETPGPDARAWLAGATEQKGSWWSHWVEWLRARSGPERAAPPVLGSGKHPPIMPAPGRYVHQSAA
jgi:polyhydroxyalkanoate synthase